MKLKKILSITLALALSAVALFSFSACSEDEIKINPDKEHYVVGICQLVTHDALDAATKGFKDADKDGVRSKIYMGPLWDLDNTLGNINYNYDFGQDTAYLWRRTVNLEATCAPLQKIL